MSVERLAKVLLLVGVMAVPVAAKDSASEAKRVLDSTRVSVDFKEAPLENVIAFLREQTGLNFHVGSDHSDAKVTMKLKDVSARTVLKYALKPHDLSADWREGVIVIESRDSAGVKTVTRLYDITGWEYWLRDFPGVGLDLVPEKPGIQSAGSSFSDFTYCWVDFFLELIPMLVGGDSWNRDSEASITRSNGLLVVTQTPEVHREIVKLLRLLEQYR